MKSLREQRVATTRTCDVLPNCVYILLEYPPGEEAVHHTNNIRQKKSSHFHCPFHTIFWLPFTHQSARRFHSGLSFLRATNSHPRNAQTGLPHGSSYMDSILSEHYRVGLFGVGASGGIRGRASENPDWTRTSGTFCSLYAHFLPGRVQGKNEWKP